MSKTQLKIYNFLIEYVSEHLYAPSMQEIADYIGVTRSVVWHHLAKMDTNGYIRLGDYRQSRAITLIGYKLVKDGGCNDGRKTKV